jgi:hypothetical protein
MLGNKIKEDMMGRTYGMNWEIRNSYFVVGKPPENTVH